MRPIFVRFPILGLIVLIVTIPVQFILIALDNGWWTDFCSTWIELQDLRRGN